MSKSVFKLYIDELGMSHPKSYDISPYYILLGCIIDERYQADLEQHANHIKFKYWGRTDVVFHSADFQKWFHLNFSINCFAVSPGFSVFIKFSPIRKPSKP